MSNQFNQKISDKSLVNKNAILMGCLPEDWQLCKSLGRKIYWLMQNHIYGKENDFRFVAYILTEGISSEKLSKLKNQLNNKQIEPLYFDTNFQLKEGLKKNTMYLRTYSKKGILIRNENLIAIDKSGVAVVYEEFSTQQTKASK